MATGIEKDGPSKGEKTEPKRSQPLACGGRE